MSQQQHYEIHPCHDIVVVHDMLVRVLVVVYCVLYEQAMYRSQPAVGTSVVAGRFLLGLPGLLSLGHWRRRRRPNDQAAYLSAFVLCDIITEPTCSI